MYQPRANSSDPAWSDADGVKIYTVSASGRPVDQTRYFARLAEVKRAKPVAWPTTAAFAIFHDGASAEYLVLAWWGNDNELFTSVSVRTPDGWIEDPLRYSFCVWDLEIFWQERGYFLECVYQTSPDLPRYRALRFEGK